MECIYNNVLWVKDLFKQWEWSFPVKYWSQWTCPKKAGINYAEITIRPFPGAQFIQQNKYEKCIFEWTPSPYAKTSSNIAFNKIQHQHLNHGIFHFHLTAAIFTNGSIVNIPFSYKPQYSTNSASSMLTIQLLAVFNKQHIQHHI